MHSREVWLYIANLGIYNETPSKRIRDKRGKHKKKDRCAMKIGKRIMAVLLYLALVSLLLGFRIKELLDLRQLILVLAGGSLLYLSGMEKGDFKGRKGIDYGLFAMDAVYARLM